MHHGSSSIDWLVPSSPHPTRPCGKNDFPVHAQGNDCRSPNSRKTFDTGDIGAPAEVLRPRLCTGVEKRDSLTRKWILGFSQSSFELVTRSTGQTEILESTTTR